MIATEVADWQTRSARLVKAGVCPYGHGTLEQVQLHGRRQGACRDCGASWYVDLVGAVRRSGCVPRDHTCAVTSRAPESLPPL